MVLKALFTYLFESIVSGGGEEREREPPLPLIVFQMATAAGVKARLNLGAAN